MDIHNGVYQNFLYLTRQLPSTKTLRKDHTKNLDLYPFKNSKAGFSCNSTAGFTFVKSWSRRELIISSTEKGILQQSRILVNNVGREFFLCAKSCITTYTLNYHPAKTNYCHRCWNLSWPVSSYKQLPIENNTQI